MVQLRNDCDCKTCTGGESKPNTFGGWLCTCACHTSGFPVDSKEHAEWTSERLRERVEIITEAEERKPEQEECDGYNVEYDIPSLPSKGETVNTHEEAEKIAAERIKQGYVNVRIEPYFKGRD
jgi:hypothetical protein